MTKRPASAEPQYQERLLVRQLKGFGLQDLPSLLFGRASGAANI